MLSALLFEHGLYKPYGYISLLCIGTNFDPSIDQHAYSNLFLCYQNAVSSCNLNSTSDLTVFCYLNFVYYFLFLLTLASSPEKFLDENHKCGTFKLRFSHDEHLFGTDNSTFYVYVFNFNTPFVLQISFSQHRQLDLLQFFITFSR